MAVTAAPPTYRVQGSDFALTRYAGTPSAAPLASADSWGSLDLQVMYMAITEGAQPPIGAAAVLLNP